MSCKPTYKGKRYNSLEELYNANGVNIQQAQQLYGSYLQTINNPTIEGFKQWNNRQQQINELFKSNPTLANEVYEALGFKDKLKTSLGKELEYKDPYVPASRLKDFKQYQVLDEKGDDIGTVVIEYRGKDTVILHPKLNVVGKGYGKDLYKFVSNKFNVSIEEWNEGAISNSSASKKMWASLEKDGDAKRIVDEEQGDNFRLLNYTNQITPQQKQEAQAKFQEYVNATGRQDIEGFKDFVQGGSNNIKLGVEELFNENPELANTVYETLGFKTKPDVILPIGTSGSGKSTFIKSLPQENLVVIEPDAMRVEFTGDMNNKSKDKEIYIEAANRAIQAIKQGKQVVFDTTNLTKDKRLPFIEAIKKAIPDANIQYKLMELNPELAKQRIKAQLARGENRAAVSDETIDRHAASYKQMLEDIKNEPISNFEITSQQKQQAQQLYSNFLDKFVKRNFDKLVSEMESKNLIEKKCD